MTINEALNKLADDDPFDRSYAWLCQRSSGPRIAALYLMRPDLKYAGIGIYDIEDAAVSETVNWLLTSEAATWNDVAAMPWEIQDSDQWQVTSASQLVEQVRRALKWL